MNPVQLIETPSGRKTTPFQLMQWRNGLALEIKTGMKLSSKGSILAQLWDCGLTNKRTKRNAYAELNAIMVEQLGMENKPL